MTISKRKSCFLLLLFFCNYSNISANAAAPTSSSSKLELSINDRKEDNINVGAKGALSLSSNDKKMYHIGLSKSDIEGAEYVILPGDPGRVPKIADFLENSKKIGQNREYTSYLGTCNGEKVLVMSTGMGGPSTAIGVEELSMLGVKNFIRVGTSGGMQLDVNAGDLVVASGAVRQEGTSKEYAPIEFPAVPDFELTRTLCDAAESISNESNIKTHVGVVHCKDSFYGQHSPDRMPVSSELNEKWNAWLKLGVECSEMETASLFVLGNYLKVRTAAILLVVWNQEQEKLGLSQNTNFDTNLAIKAVVNAIGKFIQKNKDIH